MIYMGGQTVVHEINDHTCSSIPLRSFEFVDFDDVPLRSGDKRLFTDVIGQIVSIEDIGEEWKWKFWRNIPFRNIRLHDLRGRELNVALFGDLGRNFNAEQVSMQGRKVPVVAIFAGMLVRRYPGLISTLSYLLISRIASYLLFPCVEDLILLSCYLVKGFTVCSTSASKCYLDLDIPQVQEFRASLTDPHTPIDLLPCRVQNPLNPADLVKSWRTIKQLKSLNPHELESGTTFLCWASLKGIDCTKGWFYWSCFHCKRSISGDGIDSLCIQGCPKNPPPVPRYKLNAMMEDATGAMDVMIFDDQARVLVGAAAEEELIRGVTGEKISAVLCSHQSRAFVIAAANGCFVVEHILNEDELQLICSAQVAAGVPLLSEEEGSSVSYNSSPGNNVQKEEMVVKEESEVGDDCESPQDGGSPASCISSTPVKKIVVKEEGEPKRRKITKGNEADAEQTDADCPPLCSIIISEE